MGLFSFALHIIDRPEQKAEATFRLKAGLCSGASKRMPLEGPLTCLATVSYSPIFSADSDL